MKIGSSETDDKSIELVTSMPTDNKNEKNPASVLLSSNIINKNSEFETSVKTFFSGGAAGMTAKTIVAPLDRIKIIFQVTNEPFGFRKIPQMIADIVASDGWKALWRGNSATLLRVFPYSGIQFSTFDFLKRNFSQFSDKRVERIHLGTAAQENLIYGAAAAGLSTIVTYPLDLARARLAVSSKTRDSVPLFRKLVLFYSTNSNNLMSGMYKGLLPTIIGVLPYGAIAFSSNELGKSLLGINKKDINIIHRVVIGGISGLIAQSVVYPFDVVRRRLQTSGLVDRHDVHTYRHAIHIDGSAKRYTMIDVIREIAREQGIRGFLKGMTMNWIKGPFAIGVSFATYDVIKKILGLPDDSKSYGS